VVRAALVLLSLGWAGGFEAITLRAQQPPPAAENLRDLSLRDIRGRLQLLDQEHTLAILDEDYEKASRIIQEINRLEEELLRRHWEAPIPRPPDSPPPRP
jgi:hypothetical protein